MALNEIIIDDKIKELLAKIDSGDDKAKATLGAIRGGYINTLIGDEELAISLLELLKNSK